MLQEKAGKQAAFKSGRVKKWLNIDSYILSSGVTGL